MLLEDIKQKISTLKAVHAHFAVFTTCSKSAVAQTDTGYRAGVACKCPLTFASPWVPDLDHAVLSARHQPKGIGGQSPDTL